MDVSVERRTAFPRGFIMAQLKDKNLTVTQQPLI